MLSRVPARPGPLRRALRARSGAAVVEFALCVPLLLTLLLAMADVGPALLVRFKLANATQSVADIATQFATAQTTDFSNMAAAGADVMTPFSATPLLLRITNVATDGNGRAFVYWSCGQGSLGPTQATTTVSSTPSKTDLAKLLVLYQGKAGLFPLNGANTSYVMVESQYTFTPVVGFILKAAQVITNTAYAAPRVSTYIGRSTGVPGYVPPLPTAIVQALSLSFGGLTCSFGY